MLTKTGDHVKVWGVYEIGVVDVANEYIPQTVEVIVFCLAQFAQRGLRRLWSMGRVHAFATCNFLQHVLLPRAGTRESLL